MSIAQSLLPELAHEMAGTRKELERVPEDKFGWKPHAKSMSLCRLASHLAEVPSYGTAVLANSEFDILPAGKPYVPNEIGSRKEILALFDKNLEGLQEALGGMSDGDMLQPWTLLKGGTKVFTLPKVAVLRSMCLNHNIHHRAQLGVYLRLVDVPVPSIYGPSADEQ